MNFRSLFLSLILCLQLAGATEEEIPVLQLTVEAELLDVVALSSESESPEWIRLGANLTVTSFLTNISDHDIVLPTTTRTGEPTCWGDSSHGASICFGIGLGEKDGRVVVPSAYSFDPVTIRPGESTSLPLYEIHYPTERLEEADQKETFRVRYIVDESIAKRYGWWHGLLTCEVAIMKYKEESNKSTQPTSASAPR